MAEAHDNALLTESDDDMPNPNAVIAEANFSNREAGGMNDDEQAVVVDKEKAKINIDKSETKLQGTAEGFVKAESNKEEKPVCRICLMEEDEVDNPLIAPCKCAGSMRHIHHLCLKTWFSGKRIMKVSQIVTTYFWKNLECELCKTAYPYETKSLDGKTLLNIIEYDTPRSEFGEDIYYLVLESISSNTSKVIHVVNMNKTVKMYIGRGHDAHVRVTDISVSRLHAVLIKSIQGYYFLTDNDSKFGTLALVRQPLELTPKEPIFLQIGRTIFDLEVKNPYSSMLQNCLCMGSKQKKGDRLDDLISLDGNHCFPENFATTKFVD